MSIGPEAELDRLPTIPRIPPIAVLDDGELLDALSCARIHMMYQPVVRLGDRRPVGIEALARLHHPEHGVMRPDLFVPPMEDAGLASELTTAVLRRAFTDWTSPQLEALDLTLAINVPLEVFLLPNALSRIDGARVAAGLPATRITIELTETSPLLRLPELAAAIGELGALGYGLSIDDVGPHVRDHTDLLHMKFTTLKLDKDLVRDAASVPAATGFLRTALAAAEQAGMDVIAEGIETEADWMRMRQMGVQMGQGFHVARPMPARNIAEWHAQWVRAGDI